MKIRLILIFVLIFGSILLGRVIQNPDKPLKGTMDMKIQKIWQVDEAGNDIISFVSKILIDNNDNVYVLDSKLNKVFVFDKKGKFKYSFGKKGEGPGEFKMAFNMFLMGNNIIITDVSKLHYFDLKGHFIKDYRLKANIFPRLFLSKYKFVYVKEGKLENNEMDKIMFYDLKTDKSELFKEIKPEKFMEAKLSSKGEVMVIRIKDSSTTPLIVMYKDGNYLYYGKNDKYLINKSDFKGNELFSFTIKERKRKFIPKEVKLKRLKNIMFNGGKMPKEMIKKLVESMPDYSTFFGDIRVDEKGYIYVMINNTAEKRLKDFDVFSKEGKYLYLCRVKLPEDFEFAGPLKIKGDFLYAFVEDDEGERSLMKFKISKPE